MQVQAEWVFVEFDDVGGWVEDVGLEEDVFGTGGMGAVGFGEDDDCERGLC